MAANIEEIMEYSEEYYKLVNKKRIETTADWVEILQHESLYSGSMLDILLYMMKCPDYTAYASDIRDEMGLKGIPNGQVVGFGKRIKKLKNIPDQDADTYGNRYWNIPFMSVPELNTDSKFSWKLRPELVEALKEQEKKLQGDSDVHGRI